VRLLALGASAVTIFGAMLIAGASVSGGEADSTVRAVRRECDRYGLDLDETLRAQGGADSGTDGDLAAGTALNQNSGRRKARPWWDLLIVVAALAVFVWFAFGVRIPSLEARVAPAIVLFATSIAVLAGAGWMLWKKTRFA